MGPRTPSSNEYGKNIRFETNITKFPNIAKVLYMINQTAVHAESIFITQNVTVKLDILINKLIHQGQIYNGYKNPSKNQKIIFKGVINAFLIT